MARTPNLDLLSGLITYQGFGIGAWNRINDTLDEQMVPYRRRMFDSGIFYGGQITGATSGALRIGPTQGICGGLWVSMPDASNVVSGLTNGIRNHIWLTAIIDHAVPGGIDTPQTATGQFSATTGHRPDDSLSVFVGVVDFNNAGDVQLIDQDQTAPDDTDNIGAEYVYPLMMRRARGQLTIEDLPAGETLTWRIYNYGSLSTAWEQWYFRNPGCIILRNVPEGVDQHVYEEWAPDWFELTVTNIAGYEGDLVGMIWERWGHIRPAWTGIWGRSSSPWPGDGHIPSDHEPD